MAAISTWLSPGDNAWQMTAATLVGLMSVPGLVVLYGGVMQKRWSINSMMLTFAAFAVVLVVWVLWAFKMGFGTPWHGISSHGFLGNFIGIQPAEILSPAEEQGQATIPLVTTGPSFAFPQATLAYFQFVFAAITPILMLGSVLGRINFKAWIPFVALWSSIVYTVDAFCLWGGGFFAQHGAVDFSGGYVIHLSAGVSGFVAAAVIGPRLQRDREVDAPNNVAMVAVGAGLLWLGWNGFNGGDPYFAGASASARSHEHQPVHRRRVPRVGRLGLHDRPQAGPDLRCQRHDRRPGGDHTRGRLRERVGGDLHRDHRVDDRVLRTELHEPDPRPFRNVDDTLGVVYTHGVAGLAGGLLTGIFADPNMIVYPGVGKTREHRRAGVDPRQLERCSNGSCSPRCS